MSTILETKLNKIQTYVNTSNEIIYPIINQMIYIELDYIESTGTQYIDMNTANILTSGCKVKTEVSFTSPTTRQCIFGTEVSSPFYRNYLIKSSSGFDCGAYDYNNVNYSVSANQILSIDYSTVKGNNYLKVNDSTIWSNQDNHDRASSSSYLFAFHTRFNGVNEHAAMRLYFFKLYDSTGELIRDFIPVKRRMDNVVCLYDKISNTFFENSGTGVFTAGPVKGDD